MYLVVYGLCNVGLMEYFFGVFNVLVDNGLWVVMFGIGFFIVFFFFIMNNMLMVLVGVLFIDGSMVFGVIKEVMVYVNVIGCDLGLKIILIGSLVMLFWLYVFL